MNQHKIKLYSLHYKNKKSNVIFRLHHVGGEHYGTLTKNNIVRWLVNFTLKTYLSRYLIECDDLTNKNLFDISFNCNLKDFVLILVNFIAFTMRYKE